MEAIIILHGGAGNIRSEDRENYRKGLIAARDIGYNMLESKQSAQEAVLAAVVNMENNKLAFNAGIGGSPNRKAIVECDAAIMLGDGSCGAVAAIKNAQNPILIAEKVRAQTSCVLMAGSGAESLVEKPIENSQLLTPRTLKALERWKKTNENGSNTVGAVAIDKKGNFAAATSTGGRLGKLPGRVGDTPIIGAGTYATKELAISCTGEGEAFITAGTAKELALRLEFQDPEKAINKVLDDIKSFNGEGGIICLHQNKIIVAFNSSQMAIAWKKPNNAYAEVSSKAQTIIIN